MNDAIVFILLLAGGMAFGNLLFRLFGGTAKRDELQRKCNELHLKIMHRKRAELDAERKRQRDRPKAD